MFVCLFVTNPIRLNRSGPTFCDPREKNLILKIHEILFIKSAKFLFVFVLQSIHRVRVPN